jgi:CubicO group peptidase (beta-lactamase class C family)
MGHPVVISVRENPPQDRHPSCTRRRVAFGIIVSLVLSLLVQALQSNLLWAQTQDTTLTTGTAEEVGLSAAVLQSGVQLFQDAVDRGDLVGAVLLVAKDAKVVLLEAVGWRNKGRGLPMEKNTMFRMASNTKPVIATAVSMLVEAEKLGYEDPVRKYIPSFDNYRAGFMQIKHLLSHTSGFRINSLFLEPLTEPSPTHPDAPNLQLEVARFGEVGAEVVPGASFEYSNPGYNTLGALIEIAAAQSLESFLDERIYEPLGMVDSYNHEIAEKLDGKLDRMGAVYYRKQGDEWIPGWEPGDPPQVPFVRASGGMISTAWDYAIFCQMFLNGGTYGDVRLLQPETVQTMTAPAFSPVGAAEASERSYGYGWFLAEGGIYYHGGSDGTYAWVDPAHRVIGLVFTQTPRGQNPRNKFRELVGAAILERN